MSEYKGPERRIDKRKKCLLPIKLITSENLMLVGYVINISCYLVRADITFKTINKNRLIDKILFNPDITLEFVEVGDENPLRLKAPLDIIWNKYICFNENEIYEIGFVLNLSEEQKQEWYKFYDSV